ncbi:unnamed protein product [Durusdinium trenchii]|uniref:Calcineurin-like phosphoesterase domain-containing protein n=1 Tax=Durusdinium trenchii TaxID=1381693 RepID=A0ABP0SRC3_9DINO
MATTSFGGSLGMLCSLFAVCPRRRRTHAQQVSFSRDAATTCDYLCSERQRRGLRLVIISDTHNCHRDLTVPDGDILIHAGDFTQFGKEEHAEDFNRWLGEQPHKTKLVVLGNHETNATWNSRAREVLSNATLLRQSGFKLTHCDRPPVSFFGTDFFWPCHTGNPYFDQIPGETDVLIAHNPAKGCADGGKGCPALLDAVVKLQPELVISGHVHFARGAVKMQSTLLVNGANCGSGKEERLLANGPLVIDL